MGQSQVLEKIAGASQARAPAEGATAQGRFTLDNGMAVRIRPIQGASRVALLVLYKVGGDHDPWGRSGLSHLAEHLYVTSAAGEAPARTAEAFFRRYPDGCNAQTGDRYTVIATVFPKHDLEKELREAAARMGDLRITTTDLDRERPRLLDEVANMFGRIPTLGAVNLARERIRPTPRGGRKGGLPEQVAAITLHDIREHWRRYYKPRNAILVLAGAVDEGVATQTVKNHFAKLPRGEELPQPADPVAPQVGVVREAAVRTFRPQTAPVACVAYAAPNPGTELYAPFLVLASRFWAASLPPDAGGEAGRPSLYFPLLEDPAMLGVSATARPGEVSEEAIARLDSFVADAVSKSLRDDERASTRQAFAMFLGTAELPDGALAQNPYGVALALARREQLGIDPAALGIAFDTFTERDLRRAAAEIFAPDQRVGVWLHPE
jgi:zinc protease